MTSPRLLQAGTAQERRLLRSALGDAPAVELRQKLLLSVGVSATVAAESASALAGTQVRPSTSVGPLASLWPPLGKVGTVLVNWIGIAGLALTAGTGAGFAAGTAWNHRVLGPESASPTGPANALNDEARPAPRGAEQAPVARTDATLPLPPPRVPVVAAHGRSLRDVSARESQDFAEEVRLVDASRAALRAGDTSKCLRLLVDRQRRFPKGVLGPEAAIIRIEALHAAGNRALVRTEGERFLVQHPSGPLAARVRSILESAL